MLAIIVIHFVTGEHKTQHLQKDNYKLHMGSMVEGEKGASPTSGRIVNHDLEGSGKDGKGVKRPDAGKGCQGGGVICFFRVLIGNMSFERRERNGGWGN